MDAFYLFESREEHDSLHPFGCAPSATPPEEAIRLGSLGDLQMVILASIAYHWMRCEENAICFDSDRHGFRFNFYLRLLIGIFRFRKDRAHTEGFYSRDINGFFTLLYREIINSPYRRELKIITDFFEADRSEKRIVEISNAF